MPVFAQAESCRHQPAALSSVHGRKPTLPLTRILVSPSPYCRFGGAGGGLLFARPPIHRSLEYHRFADQRTLLGIPHCLNVLSNVPFVLIGGVGLWFVAFGDWKSQRFQTAWERGPYLLFFLGVLLTSVGSAYYHLEPTNSRLVWDRLPMALAFMGLFSGIVAERIGVRVGVALLIPLGAAGIASVLYWAETDDLRPYYLVQFFPMLAIPLLLLLFPPRYSGTGFFFLALFWYVLAKFAEHPLDHAIFFWNGWVSGHTLKHLLAAVGALLRFAPW